MKFREIFESDLQISTEEDSQCAIFEVQIFKDEQKDPEDQGERTQNSGLKSKETTMTLIGQHISVNENYFFYQNEKTGEITANFWSPKLSRDNLPINLSGLPETMESSLEKVVRLVHSCHFTPSIDQTTASPKVVFQLTPPEQKEWKSYRKRNFPHTYHWLSLNPHSLALSGNNSITVWDWKRDMSSSYFFDDSANSPDILPLSDNQVILFKKELKFIVWNWVSNEISAIPDVETTKLAHVVGLSNHRFVLGYKDGGMEVRGAKVELLYSFNLSEKSEVELISLVEISPDQLIANYKDATSNSLVTVELKGKETKAKVTPLLDLPEGELTGSLEVMGKGYFVWVGLNKIYAGTVDTITAINLEKCRLEKKISDRHLLLSNQNSENKKELHLFDRESSKLILLEGAGDCYPKYHFGNDLVSCSNNIFVLGKESQIRFWNALTGKRISCPIHSPHSWGFTCLSILEDGSLASGSTDHWFYVYSAQEKKTFFKEHYSSDVADLRILPNGAIAVRTLSEIEIFVPQQNSTGPGPDTNELEGAIELQIKKEPLNFENYKKLAKLYIADKKEEALYHLYVAAFSRALEHKLYTIAHQFFLNAVKVKPDSDQTHHLYLNQAFDEKEKRYMIQHMVDFQNRKGNQVEVDRWLQQLPPSKGCKKRLLIGEGNFTYSESLLKKHKATHPTLASSITATELDKGCYSRNSERIGRLQKEGVLCLFDVDAERLHERFMGKRFERIQWNSPFLNGNERSKLKNTVAQFFLSASSLQLSGDRVHLTLAQEGREEGSSNDYYISRQINEYNIVPSATEAGYRLIGKRRFDKDRYREYTHVKTGTSVPYEAEKREFIFEKVDQPSLSNIKGSLGVPELANKLMNPHQKKYEVKETDTGSYFDCSTDDDSSDYEIVDR